MAAVPAMRKSRYNIPVQIVALPTLWLEHTAADLMRIDGDHFRCKNCGQPFPSGKGEEQKNK